jgi:glycosyltransferase involved in cell wall biosynthesis
VIIKTALEESQIDSLRFTSNHLKIALIGGFDARYKGQDVLLKAIGLLPEHIKKTIQLYFVGVGDFQWVTSLAKELNLQSCIKFIGSKESGSPIFEFLKEMSLYIQPSFTEGMPRSLLEAMSMGCPVMGSSVGGIPDVVSKDLLHKKGDYKTIAKQIERLCFNREILKKESLRSISVVKPYLKNNLNAKRKIFYKQMNKDFDNS